MGAGVKSTATRCPARIPAGKEKSAVRPLTLRLGGSDTQDSVELKARDALPSALACTAGVARHLA